LRYRVVVALPSCCCASELLLRYRVGRCCAAKFSVVSYRVSRCTVVSGCLCCAEIRGVVCGFASSGLNSLGAVRHLSWFAQLAKLLAVVVLAE
jgi:hypothetical protein